MQKTTKMTYLIFTTLRLNNEDLQITAGNVSDTLIQTDNTSLDNRSMPDEIQSELLFSLFPRSQTKSLNAYSTGITWPRIVWNKSLKNSFHSRYFSQPRGVCDRFLWSYSWLIDWFWFCFQKYYIRSFSVFTVSSQEFCSEEPYLKQEDTGRASSVLVVVSFFH